MRSDRTNDEPEPAANERAPGTEPACGEVTTATTLEALRQRAGRYAEFAVEHAIWGAVHDHTLNLTWAAQTKRLPYRSIDATYHAVYFFVQAHLDEFQLEPQATRPRRYDLAPRCKQRLYRSRALRARAEWEAAGRPFLERRIGYVLRLVGDHDSAAH